MFFSSLVVVSDLFAMTAQYIQFVGVEFDVAKPDVHPIGVFDHHAQR